MRLPARAGPDAPPIHRNRNLANANYRNRRRLRSVYRPARLPAAIPEPSTGTIAGAVASIPTDIGQACLSTQQILAVPGTQAGVAAGLDKVALSAAKLGAPLAAGIDAAASTLEAGLLLPIGVGRDECKAIFDPIGQARLGSRRECAGLLMPDMGSFDLACQRGTPVRLLLSLTTPSMRSTPAAAKNLRSLICYALYHVDVSWFKPERSHAIDKNEYCLSILLSITLFPYRYLICTVGSSIRLNSKRSDSV